MFIARHMLHRVLYIDADTFPIYTMSLSAYTVMTLPVTMTIFHYMTL